MKPGTPPPVRGDNGIEVPFVGPMEPVVLNAAGEQLAEPMPSLGQLLQACPYCSVLAVLWPASIGYVLPLPFDDVFPIPDAVLTGIAATFACGHAVLLMSDNLAGRDRVKAALYAMQADGGFA